MNCATCNGLRIGSVATLSRNFQDNFLRPVIGEAKIRLVMRSASLNELLEQLRVHKLDLILSNRAVAADTSTPWRCQQIAEQSVAIVGPPGERADRFRFPEDLNQVRLLLPGPSSDIRNQFDLLCERHCIEIDPYAEVDDMAMLRLLARDSGGWPWYRRWLCRTNWKAASCSAIACWRVWGRSFSPSPPSGMSRWWRCDAVESGAEQTDAEAPAVSGD